MCVLHNTFFLMSLSKKEKRAFHRMVTGLSIANYRKERMRFLTLTTATKVKQNITESFDTLKKRIMRAKKEKDGFIGFKFNRYFKLKTAEGNGVFHILYWGRYIPQKWLSKTWNEIHQSPIVDIREIKHRKGRIHGIVHYLLTNYLTRQPIIRMSYGWKWAWLGMARTWAEMKKKCTLRRSCGFNINYSGQYIPSKFRWRKALLEFWEYLMKDPLPTTRQIKFCNPKHTRWRSNFNMTLT